MAKTKTKTRKFWDPCDQGGPPKIGGEPKHPVRSSERFPHFAVTWKDLDGSSLLRSTGGETWCC